MTSYDQSNTTPESAQVNKSKEFHVGDHVIIIAEDFAYGAPGVVAQALTKNAYGYDYAVEVAGVEYGFKARELKAVK